MGDKSRLGSIATLLVGIAAIITAVVGLLAYLDRPPEVRSPDGGGLSSDPPEVDPEETGNASLFRVVETLIRADPSDYEGPCPFTITFSGRISVAGGDGQVSYKFIRSDGASAPVRTLQYASPGSQNVSTTWQLGRSYSGWQAIQIFDPEEMESERAQFRITCQIQARPLGSEERMPR